MLAPACRHETWRYAGSGSFAPAPHKLALAWYGLPLLLCETLRVLTAIGSYQLIAKNLPRSLETTARRPDVARETAYYLENIGNVESVDDFIGDDRLFSYAMRAFGLADMTYAKAFIRKVLTEGIDDPQSFANRLADSRYRELVEDFNFERYGTATTAFERARKGVVDRYVRQALEEDAGQQNQGVRLALYFRRKAPLISSVYDILADRALLTVVQTALGLPPAMAAADIDKQAEAITKRLDVDDLKSPAKLQDFINRFLGLWDLANPANQRSPAALLVGGPIEAGLGPDLLASLQMLKLPRS